MQNFLKKQKKEIQDTSESSSSLFERIFLPDGKSSISFCLLLPEEIRLSKIEFQPLWNLHPQDYQEVMMFGKIVKTPRWSKSFGKGYRFSGMNHEADPIEDLFLLKLLEFVKNHSGKKYNQILVNWYQDGNHYIGPHSDDETQLVPGSSIYSFSFGQERSFRVTSKSNNENYKREFILSNNSCLIMEGDMQKNFKHEVPKKSTSKINKPRINVTFRLFKE